jgi:hypothetical protein
MLWVAPQTGIPPCGLPGTERARFDRVETEHLAAHEYVGQLAYPSQNF